jgi:hypothetical protein
MFLHNHPYPFEKNIDGIFQNLEAVEDLDVNIEKSQRGKW